MKKRTKLHADRQAAAEAKKQEIGAKHHASMRALEAQIAQANAEHAEAVEAIERAVVEEEAAIDSEIAELIREQVYAAGEAFGDAPRTSVARLAAAWTEIEARCGAELGRPIHDMHLLVAFAPSELVAAAIAEGLALSQLSSEVRGHLGRALGAIRGSRSVVEIEAEIRALEIAIAKQWPPSTTMQQDPRPLELSRRFASTRLGEEISKLERVRRKERAEQDARLAADTVTQGDANLRRFGKPLARVLGTG